MKANRTLTLKRDVLAELDATDLSRVAAGSPDPQTQASCLHYMSCWWYQCVTNTATLVDC